MQNINKHKDWNRYEVFSDGMKWPKGQALPSFSKIDGVMDSFSLAGLSHSSCTMLCALQGLVNKTKIRLFLDGVKAYEEGIDTWPDRMNIKRGPIYNIYELIGKYASELKGVVIYDGEQGPHYRNLANTIAGIYDLLPVEKLFYTSLQHNDVNLPIVEDLTALNFKTPVEIYKHLHEKYWKDCTRRVFVSIDPVDHHAHIRDMAAATGAATVWLDPRIKEEQGVLQMFLKDLTAGESVLLGWWPEERSGIGEGTAFGLGTIPSDYYENATVYSACEHHIRVAEVPKKPELEDKIYLAIFLSDGDNVQYCQHRMSVLWDNKDRGMIPMNWTVSPGLADIGPGILNYYYDTATPNDCLVSGPSGLGYSLIYDAHNRVYFLRDEDLLDKYLELSEQYLVKTGLRVITIWDELFEMHLRSYEKNCRGLYGLTLEDWFQHPKPLELHIEKNRLPFHPNYPAYAETIEDIYNHIKTPIENYDGKEPLFVAGQGVTWSMTPENITKLSKMLDKLQPGKIEVVRADHFFALINEAHGVPFNLALSAKTTAKASDGSDASCTLNGAIRENDIWTSTASDIALEYSFEKEYTIDRYVVKHAGMCGLDKALNTKDFTFEVSVDGSTWTVADEQKGNTCDMSDMDITPVQAKFARIKIADSKATIVDVEIYGK